MLLLPPQSLSSLRLNSLSWRHINHADDDNNNRNNNNVDALAPINVVEYNQSPKGWLGISDRMADFADTAANNGTWWSSAASALWRRWIVRDDREPAKGVAQSTTSVVDDGVPTPPRMAVDEQITGRLGETFEICRPCTDVEMAHAYCSSDIGECICNKLLIECNGIWVNLIYRLGCGIAIMVAC